jgi:hypothetical protein
LGVDRLDLGEAVPEQIGLPGQLPGALGALGELGADA